MVNKNDGLDKMCLLWPVLLFCINYTVHQSCITIEDIIIVEVYIDILATCYRDVTFCCEHTRQYNTYMTSDGFSGGKGGANAPPFHIFNLYLGCSAAHVILR